MKILFTCFRYWPTKGGVQVVTQYLAEELVKMGNDVTVVTMPIDGRKEKKHNGVKLIEIDWKVGHPYPYFKGEKPFKEFIIKHQYDYDVLINVCSEMAYTKWSLEIYKEIKIPKILYLHGVWDFKFHKYNFRNPRKLFSKVRGNAINMYYYRFKYYKAFHDYDKIISLHYFDKSNLFFRDYLKYNCTIIENAANDDFFDKDKFDHKIKLPKKYFINVSNYEDRKNQKYALKLFLENKDISDDIEFIFIGGTKNNYYDELVKIYKDYCKRNHCKKKVKFLYDVPREDISTYVKNASLCLFTSKEEAFPISILECMAAKVPFISSDCGVMKYLPGGVVCYSESDFNYWISKLILNNELRLQFGELGYKKTYTENRVKVCTAQLMDLLNEICNKKNIKKRKYIMECRDDFKVYFPNGLSLKRKIFLRITNDNLYNRWRYVYYMRKCDNLFLKRSFFETLKKIYYLRKKNRLGLLLGYEINSINIGKGLLLYHNGPIVINGLSIIGDNCSLHGDNCIGNNGKDDECPIIGNNVDIGVGAKIIGGVKVADDVKIGAGAVVVKDILVKGATVVGIPGKVIKSDFLGVSMNDEILDKLREVQIEILDEIERVCKKNNIKYFLCGGSLLGAVRHKGFIPWDDDIDIGMAQEDYIKFLEIAPKDLKSNYFVDDSKYNKNYIQWFAKVKKRGTVFVEDESKHVDGVEKCIFIDIFPFVNIDNPNSFKFKIRKTLYKILQKTVFAKNDIIYSVKGKIVKTLTFFIKTNFLVKLEYKLSFINKNNNSKYIGSLNSRYGTEVFKRTDIFPLKQILFDKKKRYCLNNNSVYLTRLYGDYMKLPPVEKRVTHKPIEIKFGDEKNEKK